MTTGTCSPEKLGDLWDGLLTKVFDVVDKIRGAFGSVSQLFSGLFGGEISPPSVVAGGDPDAALSGRLKCGPLCFRDRRRTDPRRR